MANRRGSRKQRGSGIGFSKSKKANAKNNKKNNKKNTKKNKPKNANANVNANVMFNANANANTGYNQAMAMGRAALNHLKSQINPNEVKQIRRNFLNAQKQSDRLHEIISNPLKPMAQAEQNELNRAYANLEREIAEGRA
jgi:hypothetical protein